MQFEMFWYYLALAYRRCCNNLAMVALLTLTMAVGLASCMTALTIFSTLAGSPLPGVSDRLYVSTMDARTQPDSDDPGYKKPDSYLTFSDAKALVDAHRATAQAAFAQSTQQLSDSDGRISSLASGQLVYGKPIGLLGVTLLYGRDWSDDEQLARTPLVVIDSQTAIKLFGVENAVDRSVRIGKQLFRIVGVYAPWKPRVKFMDLPHNEGVTLEDYQRFFVPAQAALDYGVGPTALTECGKGSAVVTYQSAEVGKCRWMELWSQLDDASSVADYQRFIANYGNNQHDTGRFVYSAQAKLFGTREWIDTNHVVPNDVYLNLMLSGAFLLLCMVNVAGLLSALFLRRRADASIRRAIGACRRQLFGQYLVEAGLIGVVGGVLALPLIWLGLSIVRMQPVAYASAAHFNPVVFASLAILSLAVSVVVGILPAWHICRIPPALQIKQQ
jgi:putative ABC transport system permease protein